MASALVLGLMAIVLTACGGSDGDTTAAQTSASGTEESGGGDEALVAEPVATSEKDPADMKFRFMTQIDGVPYYQSVETGAKAAAADLGIGSLEVTGPRGSIRRYRSARSRPGSPKAST